MIQLKSVTKRFGDKAAVDNLSLEVERGEIFAFLGPNGAGKTTTIKMLTGLLKPSAGEVRVAGFDMAHNPLEAKKLIGYIPDQPYLYDKLTGREFMKFVAELYAIEAPEADRGIDRLAEKFGMSDYLDALTEEYSHGMKQRVVIATALLHDPRIIVVDEPMVGLDPASARLVKDVFRERSRTGVTVFMSTHTLPVAEEIASRIGIILKGRLRALGTKSEIAQLAATQGSLEDIFLELTSE